MKINNHLLRTFFIACSVLLLANQVQSTEVNQTTAKNVALNLYAERAENPIPNMSVSQIIEQKEKGVTTFYVLKYLEKGFAIVSADDIVQPILGYSFESDYNENDHSPAFNFYILERFKKQIYAARQAKITPTQKVLNEWSKYSGNTSIFPKNAKSIEPLLTSAWHQRWPYSALCPEDTAGPSGHVVVGCVATAMAQVLNFWEHPWHGTGSHSYTPETHPEYGELSADFENTIYNFDYMLDTATAYSEDLAQLSYHCAVAVDMNFGPNSSGAWGGDADQVSYALENYFYFSSECEDVDRSSYSDSEWITLLQNNIDSGRPVIYGGYDEAIEEGHAWVLDGTDAGDFFNCNWGWGGSDNGWFTINSLNPGTHNFDSQEHACINIHPKTASINGTLTLGGSPYTFDFDHIVESNQQLIIEPGVEVLFNGRYKLVVKGQLNAEGYNGGFINFNATHPAIGMQGIKFEDLNDNSMDSSKLFYCRFENGKGTWDPYNRIKMGGGINCTNSSKVLIKNSKVFNSSADYGGGIACIDSSGIRIHHSRFDQDTSVYYGGGIFIDNSDVVFSENFIDDNQTTGTYGAYSNGGGIYCRNSSVSFYKDLIENNSAFAVGGIEFDNSTATLDSVTINDNECNGSAGGMSIYNNSSVVANACQIFNNSAHFEGGGAIYINDNSYLEMSHSLIYNNYAIYAPALAVLSESTASLINCSLADNYKDPPSPINGTVVSLNSILELKNSILWDNGDNEIETDETSTVTTSYSVIKNGILSGIGVTQEDPLFSNPFSNDYHLMWYGYPIPDEEKSSAIDSGDPTSPLDPDGTRADMGAIPFEQNYTSIPGGTINGTLTCSGSPYYINGDLEILETDELIIEPCVAVIFQGDYKLDVRGRLHAVGTESDQITFAAADTLEGWQGIWFVNTQSNGLDSSRLIHCRVTFGNADGWQTNDKRGGAAFFSNASNVLVSNCLFNKNKAENSGGAIYITGNYCPIITNNLFEDNYAPSGGALLGLYTNLTLRNNLFQNNKADYGGAIYCHTSNFLFEGNTIINNRAELFGGGIYFQAGGTQTFDPVNKNNIYLNYAGAAGLDICSNESGSSKNIVVDTFTVQNPNKHFAWPLDKYTFSIDNHVIDQVESDLWVSQTGSDDNTGTSESDPLKTMYMACLKIMADETSPHTIYLADGVYSEGASGEVFPINWRSFVSMKGTSIEGTTIYGEDKNQLLFCYDDSGFSIDSLNFQGGYAEYGGAIRLEKESSPSISNIEVKYNFAIEGGGGIFCGDHSSPVISEISVHENTCDVDGGGIRCYNYSNATIINSEIYDNFALYSGGGISIYFYCDVILDTLTILNNTAVHGGGVSIGWDSDIQFSNSIIQANEALSHVGGYFGSGGGIYTFYNSDPVFENLEIEFNHADYQGGGIYSSGGIDFKTYNCLVDHNTSKLGGGIYIYSGTPQFYNTIISNNQTTNGWGGGIYTESCNPLFTNVTITDNTVVSEDYDYYGGALYNFNSNPVFTNSILWNNSPNEIEIATGAVTAEYCNIDGSYVGTGNINSDPLFETTINGIYDLGTGSPCINAGTPDTTGLNIPFTDFADNYRILSGRIDMGAYEYQIVETYQLDMKLFLEGPYNGTDMDNNLSNIPLAQPFDITPWNYSGPENVVAIPTGTVDWVLIEIRMADDHESAIPSTMIFRQAAFLLTDGSVVGLDGISLLNFEDLTSDNYNFVIVYHRNHLGIISNMYYSNIGNVNIDFTTSDFTVYNSGIGGYKELSSGVWGMVAGDADGDGTIDLSDKSLWGSDVGKSEYLQFDLNLDEQINNKDKNDYWQINLDDASQIPN